MTNTLQHLSSANPSRGSLIHEEFHKLAPKPGENAGLLISLHPSDKPPATSQTPREAPVLP